MPTTTTTTKKSVSDLSDFIVDKRPESITTSISLEDDVSRVDRHHLRRSMSPFSAIQESRASAATRMSKAAELMRRATDIRKAAASLAAATAHFDRMFSFYTAFTHTHTHSHTCSHVGTSLGSMDRRLKVPGAERFPSVESFERNNGMAGSGYTASSSLRRVRKMASESGLSVGGVRPGNVVDTSTVRRTSLPRLTSVSPARSSSSPVMRAGFRAGVSRN